MNCCNKCHGFLSTGYDVNLREEYIYCINCGARPEWTARRKDGMPLDSPMLCRTCKEYPAVSIKLPIKGEIQTTLCQFCRVAYLAHRKARKKELALENV